MKPIYLDYAATTPIDARVIKEMQECLALEGVFGNPASQHVYGQQAKERIECAREQIAVALRAQPEEIIFTSGATEANNLAVKGAARILQRKGKHLVTMKTEHKSVLDSCQQLEKEGFAISYLAPMANGLLDLDQLQASLRPDTTVVSVMHVNNETGVIQDVAAIAAITAPRGISLHVDAAQSAGKLIINLSELPINMLSICAHKLYGPKGVGALYLRKKPRTRVEPLIHGGGHEQGMRSGTLATHQIVGMGEAFHIASQETLVDSNRIAKLRDDFLVSLKEVKQIKLNVNPNTTVPHILNLQFEGMVAKALLDSMPTIAASTASACQGKGTEGSYVLRALGLTEAQIQSSLRISFGKFTTDEDVAYAAATIKEQFANLLKKTVLRNPRG